MKITIGVFGSTMMICAGENSRLIDDTFWIWIAVFALGMVGIAILYVSSHQTRKVQILHQVMFDKQLEMEKNQNALLANISENIHNMAKMALEKVRLSPENSDFNLTYDRETFGNTENRLLSVTNDLIDFLRLKSRKIEIINEEFNINNVLNELAGSICSEFSGRSTELIFDIDKNIPRRLIGDSLHLGQILNSIFGHIMSQPSLREVNLEISMFDTATSKVELQFKFIDVSAGLDSEALNTLFVPHYDEKIGSYIGLGLFVANELLGMMDGEFSVQSTTGRGSTYTLSLPFEIAEKSNLRMYRLPDKIMAEKKVLIVDSNYNSALAIKKMFAYFRYEVKVLSKEEFTKNIPNLTSYDIIVLHESLFNARLVEYFSKIKLGKELKIIALNSLLESHKKSFVNEVIDGYLFKPINQERIFEMIVDMFDLEGSMQTLKDENSPQKRVRTHKTHIVETKDVTRDSFKHFSGKNILIVEDNIINQKVLTNLLHLSGVNISIANNGQEAVNLIKDRKIVFDLVLMDINMPIMDGYTATQMIRLDSKLDTLPVLAFTALVLDSEIQKMFNSGINAFLAKPLNIGKLYTALALYLLDVPVIKVEEKEAKPKEKIGYEGLNVEVGTKHASNSEVLYIEVLKEFVEAYGESDMVFEKLVCEHRYEQTRMLCVDMKGLTGAIGAEDMHKLMTEILHQIVYKKYEALENYKEKYIFEIKTLNKSIQKYLTAS